MTNPKLRILLDCDGVVFDSTSPFLRAAELVTGREFRTEDVTNWDYKVALNITKDEENAAWDCINLDFPLYPGAQEGVDSLWAVGDLVFVTAQSSRVPHWTYRRDRLIERYFPGIPVIHTKHKELIHGAALIDDKASNVRKWVLANPGGLGVLWARPWNVADHATGPAICRTRDWSVVANLLRPARAP